MRSDTRAEETPGEYIARRRSEGWRWGWELNEQIKTDPTWRTQPAPTEEETNHDPEQHW